MAEPPPKSLGLSSSSLALSSSSSSFSSSSSSSSLFVAPPANEVHQLIGEQGTFFSDALAKLLISKLEDGASRRCISIVGPQNSGKSTLLNHVFNTSFEVLPRGVGQRQTTKGIWGSNSQGTLILDVAGADNIEAGDEGEALEKKLLLFSLVMSSVIIFNIKQDAIKQYNGSCLKHFQEILEHRLTIFPQNEERKVLLFCIKDYDGDSTREILIDQLKESINVIWTNIKKKIQGKPEFAAYSSKSIEDLFALEFEVVFHPRIDKNEFDQDLDRIKESFPQHFDLAEALTLSSSSGNALESDPLDSVSSVAYSNFVGSIWDTIKESSSITNEDIEAVQECSTHAGALLSQFTTEFETLRKKVKDPLKSVSFKKSFNGLVASKTSTYDNACSQYASGPKDRIRKSLVKSMMLQFLTQRAMKEITPRIKKGFQDVNAYFWDKIREDKDTVNKIVNNYFDSFVSPLLNSDPDLKEEVKKSSEDYIDNLFKELVIVYTKNACFIFSLKFDQSSWFDLFTFDLFTNVKDKRTKSLKYAEALIDKLSKYEMDPDESIEVISPAQCADLKENLREHAKDKKKQSLEKQMTNRKIAVGVAAGAVAAGAVVAGGVAGGVVAIVAGGIPAAGVTIGGASAAIVTALSALVSEIDWEKVCKSMLYYGTIMIEGVWKHRNAIVAVVSTLFKNLDTQDSTFSILQ